MSFIPLFAAWLCLFPANQVDAEGHHDPNIILDGEFEDWLARPPVFVDPADAPTSFIDFGEVRTLHDGRFVHMQADFGKTVNAQGLEGTAMILLDVDGNHATGQLLHQLPGVDIIIDLSPLNQKWNKHEGVGLRSTTYEPNPNDPAKPKLNPYDIGFAFAPTHAGRRFEFRIERGTTLPHTPRLFAGDHFNGKFVFIDRSGAIADETPTFTHKLSPIAEHVVADSPADPLSKPQGAELRIVSWNVHRGAMFTHPELYTRILNALQPDVLLLQELTDHNSAEQLRAFLQGVQIADASRMREWHVLFGQGGGDLRCAIAARAPLRECPSLQIIPMPQQPDHSVRAVGAIAQITGENVLLVSVHLKCCGRAHGPEDEQRLAEVELVSNAIKSALAAQDVHGLVISGDLNLVGSRDPLEALASNLDFDKSPLAIPQTHQLDGLSNATWSDPNQPFIPGRLDYILISDASAKILRGFVFDSRDLGPRWLEHHRLQPGDTAAASDHLPVVVDLNLERN